jgi:hypothetical protein
MGEQAFGIDFRMDEEHRGGLVGFRRFGAEVEIEGAFDGLAVFDEVVGADSFFERGRGFGGWVGDQFVHNNSYLAEEPTFVVSTRQKVAAVRRVENR